jgi:hypothetical protein
VVIDKKTGTILCTCINRGRRHDFRVYKESKVRFAPSVLIQVDSGYQGLQKLHSNCQIPLKSTKKHPLTKQQRRDNKCLSGSRVLVENVIRRLKIFKVIAERYRNRRKRFGLRLNLIAALYNYQLNL